LSFKVGLQAAKRPGSPSGNLGLPAGLEGCHTVQIEGYLVTGFVPVDAVNKMLAERPAITGIALLGMPMGSPGMGGEKIEPFTIQSFTEGKPSAVYMVE